MYEDELLKVRRLYERGLFDARYYRDRISGPHDFDSY